MKEFIDKLIERLEEEKGSTQEDMIKAKSKSLADFCSGAVGAYSKTIAIVNELAEEYNKKQEHEVWLNGCDDDTIFTMEMTNNEYEFLKRVSELANETSTYRCMPRLFLDDGIDYRTSYTEGE